jgi:hypothetical protein
MTKQKTGNAQYNPFLLVTHFQRKFYEIYGKAYVTKVYDLKLMTKVRDLFIQNEVKLGDVKDFINLYFESHKNNPIEISYILKATNDRLGLTKKVKERKKQKTQLEQEESKLLEDVEVRTWLKNAQERINKKLNK